MYECDSQESYLTPSGYQFLMEYYGLEKIAQMIIEDGGELASKSPEYLTKWLKRMVFDPTAKNESSYQEETIKVKDGTNFTVVRFKRTGD